MRVKEECLGETYGDGILKKIIEKPLFYRGKH